MRPSIATGTRSILAIGRCTGRSSTMRSISIFRPTTAGRQYVCAQMIWLRQPRNCFAGFVATQHTMTNPLVTIDGDTATCHMYIQAAHTVERAPDAPWFVMGGHYEDRLARRENGWVLTAVTMKLRWTPG